MNGSMHRYTHDFQRFHSVSIVYLDKIILKLEQQ